MLSALERQITFEDIILDLFKRPSVCLFIGGRRNSGKTDLSLYIAELLAEEKTVTHFATNIKIYDSSFTIQSITNLQDLEYWSKNERGKKLFILDEAGKSIRRRRPMASMNIKFLDNLQILRKYHLSMILIAPHEKYIDSASLGSDILDAIIWKNNFRNPKVALYFDVLENKDFDLTGLPKTSVNYDTWDSAPFLEHRPKEKPAFDNGNLQVIWDWSNGSTIKDLGLHGMELNRILRKFCKDVLEKSFTASHT